jgi:hypothetical protein
MYAFPVLALAPDAGICRTLWTVVVTAYAGPASAMAYSVNPFEVLTVTVDSDAARRNMGALYSRSGRG